MAAAPNDFETDPPEPERIARFKLARTENVGPITFRQLLTRYGNAQKALDALPDLARRGGRASALRVPSDDEVAGERQAAAAAGAKDIHLGCAGYPLPLATIDDAPPFLYLLGNPGLLRTDCIGMVGGRNASVAGKGFARKIAQDIGKAGFTVASGMARGIDTAAHEGALKTGTIAVLAGGVDTVFPPENADLYHALCENAAVISEMPPGIQPLARHFPRRNRIISGLSLAVVVIEAKRKSGSLITARRAAEQGRPVFAAPAAPLDVRGTGCNDLIRDGATLFQTARDILDDLSPSLAESIGWGLRDPAPCLQDTSADAGGDRARRLVEDGLSSTPVAVDNLVRELRLAAPMVNAALLELELAGRLTRHPGGAVSL